MEWCKTKTKSLFNKELEILKDNSRFVFHMWLKSSCKWWPLFLHFLWWRPLCLNPNTLWKATVPMFILNACCYIHSFHQAGYDLLLHVFQISTKNHRKLEKKLSMLKGLLHKNISIFRYSQARVFIFRYHCIIFIWHFYGFKCISCQIFI
jgi:hypothetical protein